MFSLSLSETLTIFQLVLTVGSIGGVGVVLWLNLKKGRAAETQTDANLLAQLQSERALRRDSEADCRRLKDELDELRAQNYRLLGRLNKLEGK